MAGDLISYDAPTSVDGAESAVKKALNKGLAAAALTPNQTVKAEPGWYPDYETIKKEEPEEDTIDRSIINVDEPSHMFDDVDGPEYVDEDYEGVAEVDGVDHFICGDFKIRQVSKPVIITRPLCQLFDCVVSKHIILDPEYQREVVWDGGRAASLISSVMMGYYIPPVIFNVVERPEMCSDGKKQMQHKRICVDGKQRLTSIWKFMTGQIGFLDSNKPQKKWYFCQPTAPGASSDPRRNILPATVKEFFKNQAFCCYEYEELSVDTEETMFQLVQTGVTMTAAEKWRGMSTPWAVFTKDIERRFPNILSLTKQARGSGFRLLLTTLASILEVTGRTTKQFNIGNLHAGPAFQANQRILSKMVEDKTPIPEDVKTQFESIFSKFVHLTEMSSTQLTNSRWKINRDSAFDPSPLWLRHDDKILNQARTFSPIEIMGTSLLIALHMDKHTDDELLEDVMWMRHSLRVKHSSVNVTGACWRTVWDFVGVELNKRRSDKASEPPFVRNARAWAEQRKKEDEAVHARMAANQKARDRRNRELRRKKKALLAAEASGEQHQDYDRDRTVSISPSPPPAARSSRKEAQVREVSFPNLGSKPSAKRAQPENTIPGDESDSSLSEVVVDSDVENDDFEEGREPTDENESDLSDEEEDEESDKQQTPEIMNERERRIVDRSKSRPKRSLSLRQDSHEAKKVKRGRP